MYLVLWRIGKLLAGFSTAACHGIRIPNAFVDKRFHQRNYIINNIVYHMDSYRCSHPSRYCSRCFYTDVSLSIHPFVSRISSITRIISSDHASLLTPVYYRVLSGLFNLLTALIANCAGCLTCGLAGCLALAASALLHGFLQVSCC